MTAHNNKKNYAYYVRKYLLTAFVVASFAAYVIHNQGADTSARSAAMPLRASNTAEQQVPVATIYPTSVTDSQVEDATPTANAQPAAAGSSGKTDAKSPIGPPAPPAEPTYAVPPTQPAPTDVPATETVPAPAPAVVAKSGYKDGQFTGSVADAYYGTVQVKVVIQKGKITNVQFLDYPHDRNRSIMINNQAVPWLQDEAIQAQSAQVDIIGGATLTSQAFIESLQTALDNAKS